jgi:hypothetical protein
MLCPHCKLEIDEESGPCCHTYEYLKGQGLCNFCEEKKCICHLIKEIDFLKNDVRILKFCIKSHQKDENRFESLLFKIQEMISDNFDKGDVDE